MLQPVGGRLLGAKTERGGLGLIADRVGCLRLDGALLRQHYTSLPHYTHHPCAVWAVAGYSVPSDQQIWAWADPFTVYALSTIAARTMPDV